MIGILLFVGFIVLIGSFWRDVIPEGSNIIITILSIVAGWYFFLWLLPFVIDGLISLIYNIIVG
jgi:hypothetical protein